MSEDTAQSQPSRRVFGKGSAELLSFLAELRRQGRSYSVRKGKRGEIIVHYGEGSDTAILDDGDSFETFTPGYEHC